MIHIKMIVFTILLFGSAAFAECPSSNSKPFSMSMRNPPSTSAQEAEISAKKILQEQGCTGLRFAGDTSYSNTFSQWAVVLSSENCCHPVYKEQKPTCPDGYEHIFFDSKKYSKIWAGDGGYCKPKSKVQPTPQIDCGNVITVAHENEPPITAKAAKNNSLGALQAIGCKDTSLVAGSDAYFSRVNNIWTHDFSSSNCCLLQKGSTQCPKGMVKKKVANTAGTLYLAFGIGVCVNSDQTQNSTKGSQADPEKTNTAK